MPPLTSFSRTCLAIALVQAMAIPVARAATITVNNSGDAASGCTLREAVASANAVTNLNNGCAQGTNGVDTIVFNSGLAGSTILLTQGETLVAQQALIINGLGQAQLTIDGNDNQQVFFANADLSINDITITGGSTASFGGAIATYNRTISISNSTITGNSSINANSGFGSGGAISITTDGKLELVGSTVSGNFASDKGGGIIAIGGSVSLSNSSVSGNYANFGGGIIASETASVSLNSSSVSDNTARFFGAGMFAEGTSSVSLTGSTISGNFSRNDRGGGIHSRGTSSLTLNNSTVSNNIGNFGGGGISTVGASSVIMNNSTVSGNRTVNNGGGGIDAGGTSSVTLNNSTVSENTASGKGGGVEARQTARVSLNNTTISDNYANSNGGGIYVGTSSSVSLSNSIVLGNGAKNIGPEIGGGATVYGNNIVGGVPVASVLKPLANNGGATQTHALVAGSPAINGGDQAQCVANNIITDQRGIERDSVCDLGAYEFEDDGCFVVKAANGKVLAFCL